jgi:hypothetical protein
MAGMGKSVFRSVDNHYPTDRHQAIACSLGWIQVVQSNDAKSSVQRPGSKISVQVITTTLGKNILEEENLSPGKFIPDVVYSTLMSHIVSHHTSVRGYYLLQYCRLQWANQWPPNQPWANRNNLRPYSKYVIHVVTSPFAQICIHQCMYYLKCVSCDML